MEIISEIHSPQVEDSNHNLEQNASNSPEVEAHHDLLQREEPQEKCKTILKPFNIYWWQENEATK